MTIEINFNTKNAVPGINQPALIDDIDAEINKFSKKLNQSIERTDTPAPSHSQGDIELVQWVLDIAQDPEILYGYVKVLLHAVNQIIEAVKSGAETEDNEKPIMIKVFDKSIELPTTAIIIKEFLKSFEEI